MQIQNRYVWLGAVTLLAVSFITPIFLQSTNDPPQQPLREPELFGFLRPMESLPPAKSHHSSATGALTEARRWETLAALDDATPPALHAEQEAQLKAARLEEATQKLRADGASESEIFRVRADAYSPEVAQRLMEADQKEKVWQSRVASYLAERTGLIEDSALPYANRAEALQQLREAHFNADEQSLISVYE